MIAKLRNGGESCIAANRIYAHRDIHDEFAHQLAARLDEMTIGPGIEPGNATSAQ